MQSLKEQKQCQVILKTLIGQNTYFLLAKLNSEHGTNLMTYL